MAVGAVSTAFGTDNQGLPVAASNMPVIRRFFVDAQDKQPQAAAEAYALYQQVDKVNRTISRLKKMGDTEALKEYRAENIDILRVGKQVRRMADNLNNLRAQLRRLEANTTLSGQKKLAKMRELRSREITLTRKIGEINQKLGR
jgi:phosphate uptake regulator